MKRQARWENVVIAESENTVEVEGNVYFPKESVNPAYLQPSETHTTCSWKGVASYYTLQVNGKQNKDAAWFYSTPKPEAQHIQNYIAFWKGVEVQ
jgi:uncharacterized protein (DUF427 family)